MPDHTRRVGRDHELVYCVISQRARGLSIGVNMNPDKRCNFDCRYCEVDRTRRGGVARISTTRLIEELHSVLEIVRDGRFSELGYSITPSELLHLREVALSGNGEPTLCPNFGDVVSAIVRLRARRLFPFFKLVLITNCTGLHLPKVVAGLGLLTSEDEVWAKLDAGTQAYMDFINRPSVSLTSILRNIRDLGRKRPVVIQSLFAAIAEEGPSDEEIEAYAQRLRELRADGTQISLVQIYSAHRAPIDTRCRHLPLRVLSKIARRVREVSGVEAEVF